MTPDQKVLLKEMWAQIFSIADSGNLNVPADVLAASTIATETASAASETASVKSKTATVKKSWFGSSKAAPSPAADSVDDAPLTRVNLADIGLSVEQLRPALWNNILGDHPGTYGVVFFVCLVPFLIN
jgi:hypothetical protein